MYKFILPVFIFFTFFRTYGQIHLLEREDILVEIKSSLTYIYNYQFTEARKSISLVREKVQGHPAIPFLEALVIYWENYPLTLENENTPQFLSLLEESYSIAGQMLQNDPDDIEGVFFDLFGKAFYVMFWADNGKPGKVLPYLNFMYKQTLMGFSLKEQFFEFYFTSGLYNYYIVAYPEKHPAYKPIAMIFRKGDKKEGLSQLKYSAENSVFLKVESKFFLSFIYLCYENNVKEALENVAALYREYPNNSLYTGLYAQILILDRKFPFAEVIISNLEKKKDPFASMQGIILRALYLEKYNKDFESAFREYQKGLKLSEEFGPLTKDYTATALMGMGRCYHRKSQTNMAMRYYKMAKSVCSYEYIINDKL